MSKQKNERPVFISKSLLGFWIMLDSEFKAVINSESTSENYERKCVQLALLLGKKDITKLTSSDCDLFSAKLIKKYDPATFNTYRTILDDSFERALDDEVISRNPFKTKSAKIIIKPINVFNKDDIKRLSPTNIKMTTKVAIVTLAICSGLRSNELIALTEDSFDEINETIYIDQSIVKKRFKNTKTDGSTRLIDLPVQGVAAVKFLINEAKEYEEETYDFYLRNKFYEKRTRKFIVLNPKTGKRFLASDDFRKDFFKPYCSDVGVKYLAPKNLRHTFISQMLTAGAPIPWIIKQVGHTSYEMIKKHYGKWINEDSRKAQSLIADHFEYLFESNKKRSIWNKIINPFGIFDKFLSKNNQFAI
jgi:integrase